MMRLTKHHGLGNDFLVLLDRAGTHVVDIELVLRACDRHRGLGADGLIRATATGDGTADAVMELYNADGSRAEMSGNGIRCLAQALLLEGWIEAKPDGSAEAAIRTDAGPRLVTVHPAVDAHTHQATVDMGPVRFDGDAPDWVDNDLVQAAWADMGNPHLVIRVDRAVGLDTLNLVELGERVNRATHRGANVHLLHPGPGDGTITIRTYERGVGPTHACGTGACAAAAVAHSWGLTGEAVEVRMPGGAAQVHLGPTIELTGPTVAIATIDYPYGA